MASDKETKQNEYWRAREEEALRLRLKDEAEYQRRIDEIYADMLESCQSEIDRFYRKYAEEESISLAEAKKRVSRLDIEAYERKAARYVEEKNFSKEANAEMRLYNATMKINRLEMLKANIGLELISGHDDLEKFMNDILQGRTEDELKRQAGILGDTIRDNAKAAHSIVNASFQNATFSERIWMYQDALKADLSKLLHSGLIQGKNPRVLARELESKFGASKYNAERLMRTELARVQTDAQKKSFQRMDFDEYTFHANSNCCDACQALNGKHFKVKDMMPGENAAPIHPSCRCSCSAYEDSDEYEAWLDYLSKGGTTEEWKKRKDLSGLKTANKSRQIKTYEELNKTSKSSIIGMKSYDEIVRHFKTSYNIKVEGFENKDLLQLKIVFSGIDDVAFNFCSAGINKIVYNSHLKCYGKMNNKGFLQIGYKGLGDYGTGVHEAIHSVDYLKSDNGTNSFAEKILKTARRELNLKRNSKEYYRLVFDIIWDSAEISHDHELLAYACETEMGGGKSNALSKKIYDIFRRELNGTDNA